ncbi:hypothetical protein EBR96_00960 [bacterium]|nr:hypothetical protein [bacterium]
MADWPPQQVVINYRNGAGSKQLLAQKLMPTDAENFEFNLELGGDIEVLFNDRLALRQRVQELIPSAKNGKP